MAVLIASPIVLRFKVADRDESSTTAHCKLVLQWRPLDKGGCSVDPEDDKCGLPYPLLLGPHIGITVCSTRHYAVTFGSPVNAYNTSNKQSLMTPLIAFIFILSSTVYNAPSRTPRAKYVSYEPELRRSPSLATCPSCRTEVTTQVTFKAGTFAWLMCLVLVLGCCLIPLFANHFKDAYHTCPRCRLVLHVHKKQCCE
uniref:LITAF domain-containing protein n=1 Tax=Amphilophus citrinellus TaxID=61819 RepID=A0A3Q0SR87_AMPCI